MSCLIVDAASNGNSQIRYANAGHCPPLILRTNGSIERLMATGTVLGVHGDFEYECESLSLSSGDHLVLYTDGLSEAENSSGERFEDEAFGEFLANYCADSAEAAVGSIRDAVISFYQGQSLDDDYTVIVLRKV